MVHIPPVHPISLPNPKLSPNICRYRNCWFPQPKDPRGPPPPHRAPSVSPHREVPLGSLEVPLEPPLPFPSALYLLFISNPFSHPFRGPKVGQFGCSVLRSVARVASMAPMSYGPGPQGPPGPQSVTPWDPGDTPVDTPVTPGDPRGDPPGTPWGGGWGTPGNFTWGTSFGDSPGDPPNLPGGPPGVPR